jgi:hypothetical protein
MSIFHDPAVLMQRARQQLQEKTLTPAETKKREEIVKSMKSSASDFEKRYPGRGKEVMYATATKQAKKVAEECESDIINHLIDEGYAETENNARNILRNMGESWAEEILSELNRLEREQGKETG